MALSPLLSISSISADADDNTISYTNLADGTVYGSPNPNRNTLAVYLAGYKVDASLVETALVLATYDPVTAAAFTATNTIDGHQRYKFIIAPQYDPSSAYNHYDVVYYVTTEKWYRSKSASPLVGVAPTTSGSWDEITDVAALLANVGTSEESENLTYQILDAGLNYATDVCLATLAIEDAKTNGCGDCTDCADPNLRRNKEELMTISYLMSAYASRQLFTKYEVAARNAQTYCSDCSC
jgi:hypothetical protein